MKIRVSAALLTFAAFGVLATGCAPKTDSASSSGGSTSTGKSSGKSQAEISKEDLAFAKKAMNALIEGDPAVGNMIDWESYHALNMDIGAIYKQMPPEGQVGFRKGYISEFSVNFKKTGASMQSLSNWRVASSDAKRTEIEATGTTGKTLLFTVIRKGGDPKISVMNFK